MGESVSFDGAFDCWTSLVDLQFTVSVNWTARTISCAAIRVVPSSEWLEEFAFDTGYGVVLGARCGGSDVIRSRCAHHQ